MSASIRLSFLISMSFLLTATLKAESLQNFKSDDGYISGKAHSVLPIKVYKSDGMYSWLLQNKQGIPTNCYLYLDRSAYEVHKTVLLQTLSQLKINAKHNIPIFSQNEGIPFLLVSSDYQSNNINFRFQSFSANINFDALFCIQNTYVKTDFARNIGESLKTLSLKADPELSFLDSVHDLYEFSIDGNIGGYLLYKRTKPNKEGVEIAIITRESFGIVDNKIFTSRLNSTRIFYEDTLVGSSDIYDSDGKDLYNISTALTEQGEYKISGTKKSKKVEKTFKSKDSWFDPVIHSSLFTKVIKDKKLNNEKIFKPNGIAAGFVEGVIHQKDAKTLTLDFEKNYKEIYQYDKSGKLQSYTEKLFDRKLEYRKIYSK